MSSLVSEVKIPAEALLPISISTQPKLSKGEKINLQHSYKQLKIDRGLLSLFSWKKLCFFELVFDEITKLYFSIWGSQVSQISQCLRGS